MRYYEHIFVILLISPSLIAAAPISIALLAPMEMEVVSDGIITENYTSLATETIPPMILAARDFEATFLVSTSSATSAFLYSLSIVSFPLNAAVLSIEYPVENLITASPINFTVSVTCQATTTVNFQLVLATLDSATLASPEMIAFSFSKECRIPGCSELCTNHGTCEEEVGICHCEPGYHGADCSVMFTAQVPSDLAGNNMTACLEDNVTLHWEIPEDIATRYDWWGVFPPVAASSFDWTTLIYWEYLNSGSKRYADNIMTNGNASLVLSSPGPYVIGIFRNDGYEPWGYFNFNFKYWNECTSLSTCTHPTEMVDCNKQCKNGGTCPTDSADTSHCVCPYGYFWKDCSLGCSGTATLALNEGVFSVGGDKRPLPVTEAGCEWLIAPPPPITSIRLSFDYVDFSVSDTLEVFSGNGTDPADRIASISGSQLLQPMELNSTMIYIKMRLLTGSQGYAGFQARWRSNFVKTNDLLSISYSHPASITFMVILAVLLLFLAILLILLAKLRRTWIIRASTPSFQALTIYGAGLGFAALPQFWGTPTPATCALRFWLPSLGWVIMFSCYLIKSWRILRIFKNESVKPVIIKDSRLLLYVGVLVLYELIFLAIWTGVDTPVVIRQADRLAVDTDFLVCSGQTTIFPILSLFSKAALIIWGVVLSLRTRNILSLFSESKYIAVAIYSVSFTSVVFVPLLYVLPQFQLLWLVLCCAGIVLVFSAPIVVSLIRFVRFFIEHPDGLTDAQVRDMTMSHKMRQSSGKSAGGRINHGSAANSGSHVQHHSVNAGDSMTGSST